MTLFNEDGNSHYGTFSMHNSVIANKIASWVIKILSILGLSQNWCEHLLHPVKTVIPLVHSCIVQPCVSNCCHLFFFSSTCREIVLIIAGKQTSRVVALCSPSGQILRSHGGATRLKSISHTFHVPAVWDFSLVSGFFIIIIIRLTFFSHADNFL